MTFETRRKRIQAWRTLLERRPRMRRPALACAALAAFIAMLLPFACVLGIGAGLVAVGRWAAVEGHVVPLVLVVFPGCLYIPFALFALVALPLLWLFPPRSRGRLLRREDAPELHGLVDAAAEAYPALRGRWRIMVTPDFNATATRRPRLFGLLPSRRVIEFGYPMLCCLGRGEAKALVAHELHHLAAHQGLEGRLLGPMHGRLAMHAGAMGAVAGLRWLGRIYEGIADNLEVLLLARSLGHEAEADAAAARASSPGDAARCLLAVAARGKEFDERVWRPLFQSARAGTEVPRDLFARLRRMAEGPPDPHIAAKAVDEQLRMATQAWDTHPSLRQRLEALGFEAEADPASPSGIVAAFRALERGEAPPDAGVALVPDPWRTTPASRMIAALAREELELRLVDDWSRENAFEWEANLAAIEEDQAVLEAIRRRGRIGERPGLDALEAARIELSRERHDEAIRLARACLDDPELGPRAHFVAGIALLGQGDDAGLRHLRAARDGDIELAFEATTRAHEFLDARGRQSEADELLSEWDGMKPRMEQHDRLLRRTNHRSPFEPADMRLLQSEPIIDILRRHPRIRRAWLIQRKLETRPSRPIRALVVQARRPILQLRSWSGRTSEEISSALEAALPGSGILPIIGDDEQSLWIRRARKSAGAPLYDAKRDAEARGRAES